MTMGDLISRDTVIKILNGGGSSIRTMLCGDNDIWINLMDAIGEIERVPAAEPVRHGKWINAGHDAFTQYRRCSSCARLLANAPAYEYCPRCGAKMDGGNECSVTHRAD